MKLRNLFWIFSIICVFILPIYADPVVTGLNVVDPDSGYNAVRNPALMSFQDSGYLSVLLSHEFVVTTVEDINSEGNPDSTIEADVETLYNGSLLCAWSFKKGRFSYGFGVSSGEESTFRYQKSKSELDIGSGTYTEDVEEEQMASGVSLTFSQSLKLNSKSSIGYNISLNSSYVRTEDETLENSTDRTYSEEEVYLVGADFSIGYYQVEKNFSAGFVIELGEHAYEKKSIYNRNYTTSTEESEEVSPYYTQRGGLSYLVGILYPQSRKLDLYLQAGLGMPYTSREKSEGNQSSQIRQIYAYSVIAGLGYGMTGNLNLGFSGIYYHIYAKIFDSDSQTADLYYEVLSTVISLDYDFSEQITFNFAIRGSVLNINVDDYVNKAVLDQSIYTLGVAIGAARKY